MMPKTLTKVARGGTLFRMMKGCIFALAVGSLLCGNASEIPKDLIGEWATAQTRFSGDAVVSGNVLYLTTNGLAMIIVAPPPIGSEAKATYNSTNSTLTITIAADPSEGLN